MRDYALDITTIVLWTLSLVRVTRLLTRDRITDFIRLAIYRRGGPDTALAYFATCPWCQGLWLALATAWAPILLIEWSWWYYPLLALSTSYVVGIFSDALEPPDDAEIETIV